MAHPHVHDHHHHEDAAEAGGATADPALDLSVPDAELEPSQLGRRGFLRSAGLLGAAAASVTGTALPAAAAAGRPGSVSRGRYLWLAGDHHIHTQFSPDGLYRVADHVQHANAYGLDWMVITDHGSVQHAKIGVEKVNPEIVETRRTHQGEMLVFQGLEWNIPAAEHGTVFVHPGANEVAVLKEFENAFDGSVNGWTSSSAANEAHALDGLDFLATSVKSRRVKQALFLANHPARKGIDSPHEIRGWRDRAPGIAIGMEGAPGHQAAGLPAPTGPGSGRGFYDNSPSADSFAGYPIESYIYGGFDWMTATVGGLWDSLLAEGKPWWITANSDSHSVYLDDAVRGPGSDFTAKGFYEDPVHGTGGPSFTNGDYWPGYYSRTHVGAEDFSYLAVMRGLQAGRVWVDHGRLLDGIQVRVRESGHAQGVTLGSVLTPRRGRRVVLDVEIRTASQPNWAQFVPRLATVDVVRGAVTGAVADRDVFTTPATSVVKSWDVGGRTGTVVLSYDLGVVEEGFYVRLRGSDGKRTAPGLLGAGVDPAGPAADVLGAADPWDDLWFYTNPVWVLPR